MKDKKSGGKRAELTVEEHLWLHRRMEQRAHELWLTGGGRQKSALDNWLRAERETWKEFQHGSAHAREPKTTRRAFA